MTLRRSGGATDGEQPDGVEVRRVGDGDGDDEDEEEGGSRSRTAKSQIYGGHFSTGPRLR